MAKLLLKPCILQHLKKIGQILHQHLRNEFRAGFFALTACWCLILVYVRYHTPITFPECSATVSFFRYFLLYLTAASVPMLIGKTIFNIPYTIPEGITIIWGCLLFAIRMSLDISFPWKDSFKIIPPETLMSAFDNALQGAILLIPLWIRNLIYKESQTFYGLQRPSGNLKGYIFLLLIMTIPLCWAASTHAFQLQYPKYVHMAGIQSGNLIYICFFLVFYLLDFVSVELLFRGFLLKEGFTRMLMPISAFYVCIHFGKPEMETISSFPGGYILGVLALHTGSIRGGIWIHIGIAALMELAGTWALSSQ